MNSTWTLIVCEFSIIICAVVGGVFLTFSDFVMRSLDRADTAAGIEVMQVINREVFKSVFFVLFMGMSALSPLLIGYAYFSLAGPASSLIMTGGAIYFAGVFVVTIAFNVPMNNRLDAKDHSSCEAASYWKTTYFPTGLAGIMFGQSLRSHRRPAISLPVSGWLRCDNRYEKLKSA